VREKEHERRVRGGEGRGKKRRGAKFGWGESTNERKDKEQRGREILRGRGGEKSGRIWRRRGGKKIGR